MTTIDENEWVKIDWFDYFINRDGIIKSKFRIIKQRIWRWWYLCVCLSNKWKSSCHFVHRLAAKTFILNICNKPEINHIDSNILNNKIDNLEWVTHSENMIHWYKYWNCKPNSVHLLKWHFWKDHPKSRTIKQYTLNWEFVREWDSVTDASNSLWICRTCIHNNLSWIIKYS